MTAPADYACRWDAPSCKARVDEGTRQLRAEVERLRRIEIAAQEVVLTQKLWGSHHDAERRNALRQLAAVVPPAVSQPQDICTWCEGSGKVATGIMEACSTQCRKCDGTGFAQGVSHD